MNKFMFLPFLFLSLISTTIKAEDDKYLWLEDIDGEESMQWVNDMNKMTQDKIATTDLYQSLYQQALKVLNNESRIPDVSQNGKWLYNFWQDSEHPRGIYRRTTLKQFKKNNPKWETILDMDQYSKDHNQNYDFHGLSCATEKQKKCFVRLSPGGTDAVEIREFNLKNKKFVENGIYIPLAKTRTSWKDENTLFVSTEFGDDSLTDSGYPRIIKVWDINQPLESAKTIFTADKKSMMATAFSMKDDDENNINLIYELTSFWASNKYQYINGEKHLLNIPQSANVSGLYKNKLVLSLKEDWEINGKKFVQGEVVIADISELNGGKGDIQSVIKPTKQAIIENINTSKHGILITVLEDVKARLYKYEFKKGQWKVKSVKFPDNGALQVTSINDESGDFFVKFESFVTPPSLFHVKNKSLKPKLMKQQDESFDGSKFMVQQFFTQSDDGTKVPYFVVMNKKTEFNGKNPTHIFSYGGFRNSLTPSYSGSYEALSGAYGKLWLERGGVFVLANIRGGGEYGPAWHSAALLKNRHKAFEDFEAVAKDLFARKITSSEHLGIEGRSNGGLLVTATMTRNPQLYSAVVCGAPLIDMKRYNKLLAGASWMGEYGNPDEPEMWEYIKTYSPYQNLKTNVKYPPVFFYTSTRDDRVHPGHARKMAAKMLENGYGVDYFENIEGGHHGYSTNEQLAHRIALSYTHLWQNLK